MKVSRRPRSFSRGQMLIDSLETRTLLAATKIMPLGDSITESFPGHASYRFFLYSQLAQAGYDVDFVGGQTGVNGGTPLYTNFDQNHEGHSGWRADEVAANAVAWATANKPDVVLLHIGTNDITQGQTNTSTITDIGNIIDNLRSVVSNVKILLAQIIPSSTNASQASNLNGLITTLASQKTTASSPVTVVDQYTGFNPSTDLFDGLHPNDAGERKISAKWYAALTSILPAPTPPAVTYLSNLTPTSSSNGWGPFENDRSNGETGSTDGHTLAIGTNGYLKGLGAHASSDIRYNIAGGGYSEFHADLGLDEEVGTGGSVVFQVYVDNVLKYTSATLTGTSAPVSINVPVTGASALRLVITDGGNGNSSDHGDWANALLTKGTPPNAPTGLGATAVNQQVKLAWTDASSDETGFRIERKTSAGGTYAQIADLAANTNTYIDASAVGGTTYYYRVYAYGSGGGSQYSNEANIVAPLPPAPTAPNNLQANLVSSSANLTWVDASSNETGFRVERKTGSGGTYAQIADLAAGSSSYSDNTVQGNQTYYYRVYAYNSGGPSGYSNEAFVTTPSVAYFSDQPFTVVSNGWGAPEKDRSNGEQGSADGKTITLNGVTYTKGVGVHAASDLKLTLNGQYTQFLSDIGLDDEVGNGGSVVFQVWTDGTKVYDSGTMFNSTATKQVAVSLVGKSQLELIVTNAGDNNDSDHADWANARFTLGTPVTPPLAPTGLNATYNTTSKQVDLNWTDGSTDETGFRVERKLGAGGTWAAIQTLAANTITWSDTSALAANTTYYYRVYAFNSGGDSAAPTNEAFITTPAIPVPIAPTGLNATYNAGKVDLNWTDASSDETGFRVERKLGTGGTWAAVQTLGANATTWSDPGAFASNSTYYYRVYAFNAGGDSIAPTNEAFITTPVAATVTYLSDLTWASMSNGWGNAEKDKSNGEQGANDGHTITLNGVTYAKGLGVHAPSQIVYNLNGQYSTFQTSMGLDDEVGNGGSVVFQIWVDNVKVYDSGTMFNSTATKSTSISVAGAQQLKLIVTNNGDNNDNDHADWADAKLLS